MEIVGRGTTACVVRKAPGALTKILTNPAYAEDQGVLEALRALDPEGHHFVIGSIPKLRPPTTAERDILRQCKSNWHMVGDKLDTEVSEMVFIDMVDGGPTLARISQMIEAEVIPKLPLEQGVKLAIDVIDAVLLMHTAGYSHSDLHIHNVVIKGFPGEAVQEARLIDFGKTRSGITPLQVQQDAEGLKGILSKIVYATDDSNKHKWNCFKKEVGLLNKGIPKIPIKAEIRKCIDIQTDPSPLSDAPSSKRLRRFDMNAPLGKGLFEDESSRRLF